MNIIDLSANKIAKAIRRHDSESSSEQVLTYSLVILLNTFVSIIIIVIACSITGRLLEGLIALFAFALLRYFSGGVHLNSSLSCTIVSAVMLIALAHISINYFWIGISLDVISLLLLLILAPEGIKNVSRMDPKYYPILKIISIIIVVSNFLIQSPLLSLVFFAQAVTLLKVTYKLVDFIERR